MGHGDSDNDIDKIWCLIVLSNYYNCHAEIFNLNVFVQDDKLNISFCVYNINISRLIINLLWLLYCKVENIICLYEDKCCDI